MFSIPNGNQTMLRQSLNWSYDACLRQNITEWLTIQNLINRGNSVKITDKGICFNNECNSQKDKELASLYQFSNLLLSWLDMLITRDKTYTELCLSILSNYYCSCSKPRLGFNQRLLSTLPFQNSPPVVLPKLSSTLVQTENKINKEIKASKRNCKLTEKISEKQNAISEDLSENEQSLSEESLTSISQNAIEDQKKIKQKNSKEKQKKTPIGSSKNAFKRFSVIQPKEIKLEEEDKSADLSSKLPEYSLSVDGKHKTSNISNEENKKMEIYSISSKDSSSANGAKDAGNQLECESELSESELNQSSKSNQTKLKKYSIRLDVVKKTIFRRLKKYYSGQKETICREPWMKSINFGDFKEKISAMLKCFNNTKIEDFLK